MKPKGVIDGQQFNITVLVSLRWRDEGVKALRSDGIDR